MIPIVVFLLYQLGVLTFDRQHCMASSEADFQRTIVIFIIDR